ncbi:MAG: signal peptidase II [Flavobacteriaceae bacterium]|nr:signal peptidase II [Flavobacteriaceae bacterium]
MFNLKIKFFFLIGIISLVVLDQFSKVLIINNLEPNESIVIFNLLNFTFVKNFGVAFSFLNNENFNLSLILSVLVLIICILLFLNIFTSIFEANLSSLQRFSMSLILCGGIGNLIDRVNLGYVIDFIDITFNPYVFNLADVYVTTGILLYLLTSLIFKDQNESN